MYRVSFPVIKRPGRGVDHPPSSSAEVKERVELYLYSPSGPSWPVLRRTLPLPWDVDAVRYINLNLSAKTYFNHTFILLYPCNIMLLSLFSSEISLLTSHECSVTLPTTSISFFFEHFFHTTQLYSLALYKFSNRIYVRFVNECGALVINHPILPLLFDNRYIMLFELLCYMPIVLNIFLPVSIGWHVIIQHSFMVETCFKLCLLGMMQISHISLQNSD
jgi:hypothetical protein